MDIYKRKYIRTMGIVTAVIDSSYSKSHGGYRFSLTISPIKSMVIDKEDIIFLSSGFLGTDKEEKVQEVLDNFLNTLSITEG